MTANNVTEIEATLLAKAATGDQRAFGELYDRMLPRVMGLAMRVLRDAAQAEEVTQEVFLEVWQLATRFDAEKGSAVGWVLRKAHCRAVDRVRSSESRNVRDFRSGLRELSDIEDSPADVVELRIESERVNRALLTLPENQRKAVTLAHLKGYSHTEVSAILHIPVGTVKTRIRTGISRLREELAIA
ncbi:MAG: polymerase sigma-70 factor, subfamily [Actinomycetota bacterium]|jgi:RNA polymerase sigma-70 factor (ECF subfamily)|nr:polymerase sigma-70 factor, subfamily [Actinomycetota bacterium]